MTDPTIPHGTYDPAGGYTPPYAVREPWTTEAYLLSLILAVLIALLVLGIVGYAKIADRLDSIEFDTHRVAESVAHPVD